MRRGLLAATLTIVPACAHEAAQPKAAPAPANLQPPAPPSALSPSPPTWPEPLAAIMKGRGDPHVQPIALPPDGSGRDRWLAFAGTPEMAVAAWRVAREPSGDVHVDAVDRWPVGVRVLGGIAAPGATYVLVQSLGVLDQPASMTGVWIDAGSRASPFDASPLALADVHDAAELAARVAHPPDAGAAERNAVTLLATLRAASGSTAMLARTLAAEGADVGVVWQSTFVQKIGRLDGEGAAPSPLADRVLAIVKDAVTTHACGADTCEAWTDAGHAVVRFAVQGGRWVVRAVYEDAQARRCSGPLSCERADPAAAPAGGAVGRPREVPASADSTATEAALRAHARTVDHVLGEAPLTASGGTIGVGLTDLDPDVPVVAAIEGGVSRVLRVEAGTVRAEASEARWEAAFADVDGDGRTDVVVRMSGTRAGGAPVAWTQAFLAPVPSVQDVALEPDLASALATMDAADAAAAARAAAALSARSVPHDEACRILTTASTVAGFRRVASADARVLLFAEPGMPTWRPKVVPASRIGADDVRGLGAHCPELACSRSRMYCSWAAGADSLHAWFVLQGGQLALAGAADYQGE
jgi:hypothetical protein